MSMSTTNLATEVTSRMNGYLATQDYGRAYDCAEAFLLVEDADPKIAKEMFGSIQVLMLDLDPSQREELIQEACKVLSKFPALKNEQVCYLIQFGDLHLQKGLAKENLLSAIRCYATALAVDPKNSTVHKALSRPFFFVALEGYQYQLGKIARKGKIVSFEQLLDAIPIFHQKFSQDEADIQSYYKIALEVYRGLIKNSKKNLAPYLLRIQKGEESSQPLPNKKPLTEIYQQTLSEARTQFEKTEGETRTLQKQRTESIISFYKTLIEDALFIVGEPPCKYDIRAMGSLAREEVCPYSDLEYFILIEDEKHRPYFQKLAEIIDFQILSLGETDPKHQADFDFGQKTGLEIDHQSNPAYNDSLIGTVNHLFAIIPNSSTDALKAKKSLLRSISLCGNHNFSLPCLNLKEFALDLLTMRRKKFTKLNLMQGEECEIKMEFAEPLFHFLGDLGLYFGLQECNTLDIIDRLPCFDGPNKELLKFAVSFLYHLRVWLHLQYGGLQEIASLIPSLDLPVLKEKDVETLRFIHKQVLIPLYRAELDQEIDLIRQSFQNPNPEDVVQVAKVLRDAPLVIHEKYYRMLSSPDQVSLQALYLEQVAPETNKALAEIPNRAGFRQSRHIEEQELIRLLEKITTDDPTSGVKIRCPQIGERYLTDETAKKLLSKETSHILRTHEDSLHAVNQYGSLHFKEMPYQPMMEYAIHSLTHRIMGKAGPISTLARIEVPEKNLAYPVLISETLLGKQIDPKANLNLEHLTWLRLCEILTKPGDGRLSNYLVRFGKVYCIDNDISFMEPMTQGWLGRKVTFCSILFTLDQPLYQEVLESFCKLEPDLILTDWLEELQNQEKVYNSLFSDTELEDYYTQDQDRRFTPKLLLAKGTIATLCMQFYKLQDSLRQTQVKDPLLLLRELISLNVSETSQVGILVESQYRRAFTKPFSQRLETATSAKTSQSMTSQRAMQINYKTIPTYEEVQNKTTYSLEEAMTELCLLESQKLWNQVFITQNEGEYALEADFTSLVDPEREKLMLKALKHLYTVKKQKPQTLTLRNTKILTASILEPLLHENLKTLDLSYGAIGDIPILLDIPITPSLYSISLFTLIEKQCPNLESLHLEGCLHLTRFTLKHPNLKTLNLSRCAFLKKYNPNLPGLQELRINYTPFDSPEDAFGPTEWMKFFGPIGSIPPLPPNIEEILNSSCPFWPEQKVRETHFLVLIPKTVNGMPLTIDKLQELVKNPKEGAPTTFSYYHNEVKKKYGSKPVEQSYWVLMTKDILPNSRTRKYEKQKALINKYPNYDVPKMIELITVIFMHTFKTGSYIYTDGKLGSNTSETRSVCAEKAPGSKEQIGIGNLSKTGLPIGEYLIGISLVEEYDGISALMKFR